MKQVRKEHASLIAVVVAIVFCLAWTVYGQNTYIAKPTWEYFETVNSTQQDLNRHGAAGWELVGFSANEKNKFYLFKRAK